VSSPELQYYLRILKEEDEVWQNLRKWIKETEERLRVLESSLEKVKEGQKR